MTIIAPQDCTEAHGLRHLLNEVRAQLSRGVRELTIDLSGVRRMNARLLATVLLLVREVGRTGGTLRLEGAGSEFRKWASIFNVLAPLERRGVINSGSDAGLV